MSINLAALFHEIAAAIPDREAIVFRDRRLTYGEMDARSSQLANFLLETCVRPPTERDELENWQSGQDHVAIYMYNCNEYPECILGALKSRSVPVNINYRYVEEELLHVMQDAAIRAIVFQGAFADKVESLRRKLPSLKVLIQIDDGSGAPLLEGAYAYEDALAGASAAMPGLSLSPDDVYMLYTGGTTGMPKGVLWRQADFIVAMLGMRDKSGAPQTDVAEIVRHAEASRPVPSLAAPPYMHGAGQLLSFIAWLHGNKVVLLGKVESFDAAELLELAERERVHTIGLVGDAFARPIADELDRKSYDLSGLRLIASSGAVFSNPVKDRILAHAPQISIFDAFGSTESGAQSVNVTANDKRRTEGDFVFMGGGTALNADKTGFATPEDAEPGWFASTGAIPLGYLNDAAKTQETFPTVDGVRYSAPGDRVRLKPDGDMAFLGRDSITINSGGEKIFAEEVEKAIRSHDAVADVLVSSRPSERFGNEVVAIVQTKDGDAPEPAEISAAAGRHIARFKLPKAYVFVDKVKRGQNGKADYQWAKAQAEATLP